MSFLFELELNFLSLSSLPILNFFLFCQEDSCLIDPHYHNRNLLFSFANSSVGRSVGRLLSFARGAHWPHFGIQFFACQPHITLIILIETIVSFYLNIQIRLLGSMLHLHLISSMIVFTHVLFSPFQAICEHFTWFFFFLTYPHCDTNSQTSLATLSFNQIWF